MTKSVSSPTKKVTRAKSTTLKSKAKRMESQATNNLNSQCISIDQ